MKVVAKILTILGLLTLVFALLGRFLGQPGFVLGIRIISVITIANTLFMMAILIKLSEKK
ncbi:MAG: hypothetical protein PHT41_07195 [Candidatus Omnitrophica bacterium]|nr:hypothetical protein [Candidatus Omnitrophota bacterium]